MTAKPLNAFVLALSFVALLLNSCTTDTCTQGDNMTDPRVAGGFDASAPSPSLVIVWDTGTGRGAELPDAYFEAVSVADTGQASPPITAASYTASQELTVTFGDLTTYLSTHDIIPFTLEFPDRRGFIDCTHGGMADMYLLEVTMHFSQGEFVSAEFEQVKQLGAL